MDKKVVKPAEVKSRAPRPRIAKQLKVKLTTAIHSVIDEHTSHLTNKVEKRIKKSVKLIAKKVDKQMKKINKQLVGFNENIQK